MEEKKNLNEYSIYNNYNGTYELNTVLYKDINLCCCFDGKKIIMNDRNKFTFVYKTTGYLAFIFLIFSIFPFTGLIYGIIKMEYNNMFFCFIFIFIEGLIIGFCLNYYNCLILDQNTVTIIKRRLLYNTSLSYERCELEKFKVEFRSDYDVETGSSHHYYFNFFLKSGKIETIYSLIPTKIDFNKEGIDTLTKIINQYIQSL